MRLSLSNGAAITLVVVDSVGIYLWVPFLSRGRVLLQNVSTPLFFYVVFNIIIKTRTENATSCRFLNVFQYNFITFCSIFINM